MHHAPKLIQPHVVNLGGFEARRLLPNPIQTMVGPFIFFDHLGPAEFDPGKGVDVRPHPHINLATVTYLFEGVLLHRDSLGTVQEIHPGAVNWMTAGRGIVHSERTPEQTRLSHSRLHAIQTWVALPEADEETEPWFRHHPVEDLPHWEEQGAEIRLIAGQAFGQRSPVQTFSPIIYLDIMLQPGAALTIPADYSELGIYSVTDGLSIAGDPLDIHTLAIFSSPNPIEIAATTQTRCVVIGGEPLGERHKWWNFVSSRPERIEQAKQDWQAGRFDPVPQETEFIPLPEEIA
jgi:redox-sensitive bicupin YhaK (pirin superfamily)